MNAPAIPATLAGVITRYRQRHKRPERAKKPGRPLKRTAGYLSELLRTHDELKVWFCAKFSKPPRSDRELYSAYFAEQFLAVGERPGRTSSTEFQGALKTLRNELAEARRMQRPRNAPITGTSSSVESVDAKPFRGIQHER